MSGVLRNLKHERFAHMIVAGMSPGDAILELGYKDAMTGRNWLKNPKIEARINELLRGAAARAELTRRDIYNGIFDDIQLARKLGQPAAALKGWEMLGKDIHKMFVERKEVGNAGDFDGKSIEELAQHISKELTEMGITPPAELKELIENTDGASGTSNSITPTSPGSETIN